METLLADLTPIMSIENEEYHFIKFKTPDKLICWRYEGKPMGINSMSIIQVGIRDFDIETLKEIKTWDEISENIRKEIEGGITEKKRAYIDRMEKARKGKRNKYPNIPRVIECTKCSEPIKINPGTLAKKLEKSGVLIIDYVKNFKCKICNPSKKGRQADPKNAPKTMTCKCGKKMTYPMSHLRKLAEKKGMTIEKMIKGYSCQSCSPSRGRKKGWKKKK